MSSSSRYANFIEGVLSNHMEAANNDTRPMQRTGLRPGDMQDDVHGSRTFAMDWLGL